MGKKQQPTDTIASKQDRKKAKDLAPVLQAKEQQQPQSKAAPVAEASKKIKKVPKDAKKKKEKPQQKPKLAAEKIPVQAAIDQLDVNHYSEFVKVNTVKYMKIRNTTIKKLAIDKNLVKKASKALLAHYQSSKKSNNLLDSGDDFIYLEIVLSQVPTQYTIRPVQISLPHPIYSPEYQSQFAVIARDPQREYKDKIQDLKIPTIAKVIGYSKLSKKYPQYGDKRKLAQEFDLFFCDYRIYNLLARPTGKAFYERKKIPFPIDCEKVPEHLKDECPTYESYLNSFSKFTYFSMGNGPVYTVKVARVNMDIKDVVKNIIHGVYNTVPHILRESIKHTRVRQISIKTSSSISLPIFNQLTKSEIGAMVNEGNEKEEVEVEGEGEMDEE